MANYFRNENFKILLIQKKKELNSKRNILNIILLIIKLQSILLYQLLENKYIRFCLF